MTAYYNEIDPFAAQWLRNLISAGHIAPGEVDTRSIEDVRPADLVGFTQCHFFAGIGVWSAALRGAGWADDRQVWTGSCPCQPFSAAGKGGGFADERHLWPAFFHLIRECRPGVVFGEQVASKDGLAWLDLVLSDLEAESYAAGAVDLCAAGVGAPHIRQRLYWMADANHERRHGADALLRQGAGRERAAGAVLEAAGCGIAGGMGHAYGDGARRIAGALCGAEAGEGRRGRDHDAQPPGHAAVRLGDADCIGREGRREESAYTDAGSPGAQRGGAFWGDAEWLPCRDGKSRPAQPGAFPLAYGALERVGRLRAYGNAIVKECAQEVIGAYMGAALAMMRWGR